MKASRTRTGTCSTLVSPQSEAPPTGRAEDSLPFPTLIVGCWLRRGFDRSFAMLSGCHNHYGYEPQYGDLPTDGSATDAQEAEANALQTYKKWAPAVAHKKGMYNKEGKPVDMYVFFKPPMPR